MLLIDQQTAVDGVRQPPFQAPQGLLGRLALGQLAPVVDLPGAGPADLHHRHHVQGVIQHAVPGPGQPVADDLAAGGFQRRGAGVGGEVILAGEPADVADLAKEPGRQHGTDPEQLQQAGVGPSEGGLDARPAAVIRCSR